MKKEYVHANILGRTMLCEVIKPKVKRESKTVIGYGSAPNKLRGDVCTFVWHVDCHEPMRQSRKQYALSMDSAFYRGYDFRGATCAHCKQPMPTL